MSDQDTEDNEPESAPWGRTASAGDGAGPGSDTAESATDETDPFDTSASDDAGLSSDGTSFDTSAPDDAGASSDGNPFDKVTAKGGATSSDTTGSAETSRSTEASGFASSADANNADGIGGSTDAGGLGGGNQSGSDGLTAVGGETATREQRKPEETDPTRGRFGTRNYTQDLVDFELVLDDDLGPEQVTTDGIIQTPNDDFVGMASVDSRSWTIHTDQRREQILTAFQGFLSSLDFYVQIVCYPGAFDISEHIDQLTEQRHKKENAADESSLVQHGRQHYPDWLRSFIETNELTQRDYYVLVRVDPMELRDYESQEGALDKLADTAGPLGSVVSGLQDALGGGTETQEASVSECVNEVITRLRKVERGLRNIDVQVDRVEDPDEVLAVVYNYYNNRRPGRQTFDAGTWTTHDEEVPTGDGRIPDDLTTSQGGEVS